jgi:hypothetical protein
MTRSTESSLQRSVSSGIFTFLFVDLSTSIYLFYLVLVLSFDACIVTTTWARLCIVISLWVMYLT